ncbi:hypothetical protein [Fibrella arboris]|uniref:hypothetical protein n=1 Tax=Fibrella arboris TaxID=3242486 RepID=UPI00352051AA
MKDHRQLSDDDFAHQFETAVLDPALFNHEAHLRVAWLHLAKHGAEKAVVTVNEQLIGYVACLGARDKYNRTLTTAAIKTVHHFMQRAQGASFLELIDAFPQLTQNFRGLLASHYSVDIFGLDLAKATYLEPDLLPFD